MLILVACFRRRGREGRRGIGRELNRALDLLSLLPGRILEAQAGDLQLKRS
jgi:hypothetical protein